MILQPELKPLIKELSEKYNLSQKQIIDICDSQFFYLKDLMLQANKEDFSTFKAFRLPYLGAFIPSAGKHHYTTLNKLKKDAEKSST